jgi:hypothetical protein
MALRSSVAKDWIDFNPLITRAFRGIAQIARDGFMLERGRVQHLFHRGVIRLAEQCVNHIVPWDTISCSAKQRQCQCRKSADLQGFQPGRPRPRGKFCRRQRGALGKERLELMPPGGGAKRCRGGRKSPRWRRSDGVQSAHGAGIKTCYGGGKLIDYAGFAHVVELADTLL